MERIGVLLAELTTEEKVSMLAGRDMWHTTGVARLGIPELKLTDGPNGARGAGTSGASAACLPVGLCLADDRKACKYGMRGARFFAEALGSYYFSGKRPTGELPISREFFDDATLDAAMSFRGSPDAPAMNVIGDPEHCKEIVSRFQAAGVDELILVMQAGTIPHELIMESIKTFGEQVMPHFADSDLQVPAAQAG